MKIIILGEEKNTSELLNKVKVSIDELGLTDFIVLESKEDDKLKEELKITKEPALIIEEESIDFKDTIFEGISPEPDEIKSMLVSIVGGGEGGGCAPEGCGSGCSC